ncbi:putative ankyrin repeat protein RF_0381 [Watersipora subatra]|uniref:putative ankyrin repeat protein RF_0381 n=1 Tax=Watersipora subatra TaxID=2589382 RepID=UPI00355B0D78
MLKLLNRHLLFSCARQADGTFVTFMPQKCLCIPFSTAAPYSSNFGNVTNKSQRFFSQSGQEAFELALATEFSKMSEKHKSNHLKQQNANLLLHSSLVKGNKSTLLEALKLGCDLKSLSKHGDPPLVAAAAVDPYTAHDPKSGKDGMLEIIDVLLEHKDCDINARGAGGDTALHRSVAVRAKNRIKYLLERGCDVDIRDSRGQTALFEALGFIEGLELILRYQPLLDVYDAEGNTPLIYCMMSESPNSLAALNLLTDAGCNTNCVSSNGKTGLMVTLRSDGQLPRSSERVEKSLLLIAHGININAQDAKGRTALHHAVSSECLDLIKVLLKNKASVEIKDNAGQTVQEVAKLTSNSKLVRLIERAADKSARLLPYEDAMQNLEGLYEVINDDGELRNDQKLLIGSQITALENSLQGLVAAGRGADMMAVEHKRKLTQNRDALCEEMMPRFLLKSLLSDKILSEDDVQTISAEKSRSLMCVKLLDLIVHRGSRAYSSLLRALRSTKQAHVCKILGDDEEGITK